MSVVVLSSVIKSSPIIKMKKESPKNQKIKIIFFFLKIARDTRNTLKKAEKTPKSIRKV